MRLDVQYFCVIFRTVVFIFIVVSCNVTFRQLYPPAFLKCPLFIWAQKLFNLGNHFLKFDFWSKKAFVVLEQPQILNLFSTRSERNNLWPSLHHKDIQHTANSSFAWRKLKCPKHTHMDIYINEIISIKSEINCGRFH